MGLYCEPAGNKREWIIQHGTTCAGKIAATDTTLPVAFLDNGAFYALAVGFSVKEIRRLQQGRSDAAWFNVEKAVLRSVVPGGEWMEELK